MGLDTSFTATLRADTRAGLVVFLVALPLCLGVALASGAPLMSGIITGIIGGVLVARLSGSQLMVSGPAAGLTAIVAVAILKLGSFPAFLAALVIAGLLQLVLWKLRADIIAHFFPSSVIKGMLAAIGITLVLKQLPFALGAVMPLGDSEGAPAGTVEGITHALSNIQPAAIIIASLGVRILALWERPPMKQVKLMMPAPLAVVLLAVVISLALPVFAPSFALRKEALVSLSIGVSTAFSWCRIGQLSRNRQ